MCANPLFRRSRYNGVILNINQIVKDKMRFRKMTNHLQSLALIYLYRCQLRQEKKSVSITLITTNRKMTKT